MYQFDGCGKSAAAVLFTQEYFQEKFAIAPCEKKRILKIEDSCSNLRGES